jgi:hypothetical protein
MLCGGRRARYLATAKHADTDKQGGDNSNDDDNTHYGFATHLEILVWGLFRQSERDNEQQPDG